MANIMPCQTYGFYSFTADNSSCVPEQGCASPEECSSPPNCCCGATVSGNFTISWPNFCRANYKIYCSYARVDNYGTIGGVDVPIVKQPEPLCYDLSYIDKRTEIEFTYDYEAGEIKIPYSVTNDTTSCGPWGGLFFIEIVACPS
jgi:hypothetical protein